MSIIGRAATIALIGGLATAIGWAWIGATRTGTGGTAVIGDDAPAILDALGSEQALPLSSATFTVVSVAEWDRLRYIADMAELCRSACVGDVGLVRVIALDPRGSRKVVMVNRAAWGLPQDGGDLTCLAQVLRAERGSLAAPGDLPTCATEPMDGAVTRWSLPFGL